MDYDKARRRDFYCVLAFPVVVVDGLLFECYLEPDSDQIRVEEIKSGTLVSRNPVVKMPHTIVSVVTVGVLDEFVRGAQGGARAILARMRKEADSLSRSLNRSGGS
jgi:hypothetical protein